jgi:hypothetical protein
MKKPIFTIVANIAIIAAALFIFYRNSQLKSKYDEIRDNSAFVAANYEELLNLMELEYTYVGSTLPDVQLVDEHRDTLLLSELADEDVKVVFRFHQSTCNACAKQELELISAYLDKIPHNVVVLGTFQNHRAISIFMQGNKVAVPWYFLSEEQSAYLPKALEESGHPYTFALQGATITKLHLGTINNRNKSARYFKSFSKTINE